MRRALARRQASIITSSSITWSLTGTLVEAAKFLKANGAKDIYAACTHLLLSGDAINKLKKSGIKEVIGTNTLPLPDDKKLPNIKQLSIAKVFGEAILRIHKETSVSSLFN